MKTYRLHLILALATGAIGTAQPPEGPQDRRPPQGPPVPPVLALFDLNRDGMLSADEIKNAAEVLAKFDRNGDGKITREETRPPKPDGQDPQGPPPDTRPVPPLIAALDANKDGTISADELANAPESLKQLDKNGDSELSPEELHVPGPPPPPNDGPGDGGPPPAPEDDGPVE